MCTLNFSSRLSNAGTAQCTPRLIRLTPKARCHSESMTRVGSWEDSSGTAESRGFLSRLGTDRFLVFDYPGAAFTSFNGINNDRLICGRYDDGSGLFHGFLAQVVTGQ